MGNIAVIGDRKAGKTSILRALSEQGRKVHIEGEQAFAAQLYNPTTKEIAGTDDVKLYTKDLTIALPDYRQVDLTLEWIDTPGEIWEDVEEYARASPAGFQDLLNKVGQSAAVILLLPPHQGLLTTSQLNGLPQHLKPTETIKTPQQWQENLKFWTNFLLRNELRSVKHIILAIHKADLFCQAESLEKIVNLFNNKAYLDVRRRCYAYFRSAVAVLEPFNMTDTGSKVEYFITTTENIDLLELPFLYLADYLNHHAQSNYF